MWPGNYKILKKKRADIFIAFTARKSNVSGIHKKKRHGKSKISVTDTETAHTQPLFDSAVLYDPVTSAVS
jgi:hypothetical protein